MKRLSTVISCICLLSYGLFVGLNNKADPPAVKAAAAFANIPYDLRLNHVIRDTIYIDSIKECGNKTEKIKIKKIPYAVHDTLYVPVLYIATTRDRKATPLDSCKAIYSVRKANEQDSLLYISKTR